MSTAINAYTNSLLNTNRYEMDFSKAGSGASSSNSSSSKSSGGYIPEGLEKALQQALDEIAASTDNGSVNAEDVKKYQELLEKLFADKVRDDLTKLGITDMNFKISLDPQANNDSAITIVAQNAQDKATIEKYFKDNPAMVEEFRKIQALTNLDKAMTKNSTPDGFYNSAKNIKVNYQAMAMDIFTSGDNGDAWDFTSLMASFNGGDTSFSSGINYKV